MQGFTSEHFRVETSSVNILRIVNRSVADLPKQEWKVVGPL